MALLLFDGFEIAPTLRNSITNSGVLSSVGGRTGGKGVSISSGLGLTIPLPAAAATVIAGVAFKENGTIWGSGTSGNNIWQVQGDAGATSHLTVGFANDGKMTLKRAANNGTVIATSAASITPGVWHYMEIKATIADAGGICIVKIDGAEWINFTGDTKNSGTLSTVSTLTLGSGGGSITYDDMYVLDGTGASYNDFLGDKVVKRATPDGAGASTGFTPSAGSNYQCVDEDPWTTADYVAAAATATDLYTHSDVSGFSAVDATQVVTYSLKTDAGARTLRTVTRSALGTSAESADLALSTSVAVVQGPIRQTDPDGATWTQSLVNSAQYGVKAV